MRLIAVSLFLLQIIFLSVSYAQTTPDFNSTNDLFAEEEPEFLPEEQAFVFEFSQQGDKLKISWDIQPGYYLYKKQFKFVTKQAEIGEVNYPASEQIEDEFFGVSDVFFKPVTLNLDILQAKNNGVVKVRYQGCAEAGLCYPPTVREIFLSEVNSDANDSSASSANSGYGGSTAVTEQDQLKDLLLSSDSHLWVLGLFFLLGLGLAFTPCVFPMYPILSGIIVGQGSKLKTSQAFTLSFAYVQGMALTYSALGLVVASAGMQYQVALQHPVVLISLAVLFVVLSLSMFGVYELTLPSKWQEKLTNVSNNQKGGQLTGVFIMGALSGLVASPCTTAPLSGALLYVAQTGDLVFGGAALYALSLGMGLPLLALGTSGGKLLPKAGAWMNVVKVTFGFMLIAVSILMLERLIAEYLADVLWSLWLIATFSYFFTVNTDSNMSLWKGVRSFIIFIGLFAGAFYGYHSLSTHLSPNKAEVAAHSTEFIRVKDVADIEQQVQIAAASGKYVMLDLYADWCIACKEFEEYTFPDPGVQDKFKSFVLLQADLTENTPSNISIWEHYSVLGLPTMLFFDRNSKEMSSHRVTGFMRADKFVPHLQQVMDKG